MIVKAAVARRPHAPLILETLALDEPRPDEILVRLVASGVGWADVEIAESGEPTGLPIVPGSEGAGLVERIGADVTGLAPGDAVVLTFAFCGHCPACLAGTPSLCVEAGALNRAGLRPDGSAPFTDDDGLAVRGFFGGQSSFATHAICRATSAILVSADTPLEVLAPLGGEVWRGASALLHAFAPKPDDALLIAGADCAALAAVMTARALGLKTIVVATVDPERRALATACGATAAVHGDADFAAMVASMTGTGARYALDSTGRAATIAACRASLAPGGRCGLLRRAAEGSEDDGAVLDLSAGSGSPHDIITTLAKWFADGCFPLEQLVSYFPFEHANDALGALSGGTVVKPVLRFSLGPFGTLDRADAEGAAVDEPIDTEKPDETEKEDAPAVTVSSIT